MMEAAPTAAFEVAKSKLLIELQIIVLDPPTLLGDPEKVVEAVHMIRESQFDKSALLPFQQIAVLAG